MKEEEKLINVDRIANFFSRENWMLSIRNLRYLPRWIVVGIDVVFLVISFLFTRLIINGIGLQFVLFENKTPYICLLLGINIFSFWLFRTYAGIIRHSSYIDAIKLLFSQASILGFFVVLNFIFELFYGYKIYLSTALFIYMVLSFCSLFLYRVVIKQVFEYFFFERNDLNLPRTIIYGTDANALAVANALKLEVPTRFKIVGFVDKNSQNSSKRM
ncbi:MAG: polysaccharide biosynthesis protein, partial [Flavobacterium sp.]